MSPPYTSGVWQVRPGMAEEFVEAWTEFAEWSAANARGTSWVKLLRDTGDENRFISIGPWEDLEAIQAWRALPGWAERISRIRDLLVSFEPQTLEVVFELG